MDAQQILHDLTWYEELPVAALRAADENRDRMVPVFLAEIEHWLTADEEARWQPNPLFFIFHLLGSWREKSAYRVLARFLRSTPLHMEEILGDCETETSHRVMAGVFDGDPQPLFGIILDRHAGEFIRSRMLEALAMLTLRGDLPREETAGFLRKCWDELWPRQDCFVWHGWQSTIAMLGLSELRPLVLRAFACGAIDRHWMRVSDFDRDLSHAIEHSGALPAASPGEFELFGDTISELSDWCDFVAREVRNRDLAPAQAPAVNRFRNAGRNDPCPCGSGMKFKKCCLRTPALVN
jgi:hypothetical protein